MAESQEQTEFYFDVQSGALLVGSLAVEAHIEAGGNPADIHTLGELLTSEELIVSPKVFEPMPKDAWDSADDVPAAQWLHGVVGQYSPDKVLSQKVVRRAGYLGLVPREPYFAKRPGSLARLYVDAGLEGTPIRNFFDYWTTEDFVNYIHKLAAEKGDKPTFDEIRVLGRHAGNPSDTAIEKRFGKFSVLFELAGYVQVHAWSRDDFIDWGVRFMEANDGQYPKSRAMAKLSARHLGPSFRAIYIGTEFTSLLDFQTEVIFAYEQHIKYKKESHELHLLGADLLAHTDPTFKRVVAQLKDEDDIVRAYAKYQLVNIFAHGLHNRTKIQICVAKRAEGLTAAIMEENNSVTAADIENEAQMLRLFDVVWPMDSHLRDLRVIDSKVPA